MLVQQSAFLSEMSNPICESELSGFHPYKVSLPFPWLNTCFTRVQPLEAEFAITRSHVSVTIKSMHNPIPCEESVPYPQSDPL
jgi:hypothetical protein